MLVETLLSKHVTSSVYPFNQYSILSISLYFGVCTMPVWEDWLLWPPYKPNIKFNNCSCQERSCRPTHTYQLCLSVDNITELDGKEGYNDGRHLGGLVIWLIYLHHTNFTQYNTSVWWLYVFTLYCYFTWHKMYSNGIMLTKLN